MITRQKIERAVARFLERNLKVGWLQITDRAGKVRAALGCAESASEGADGEPYLHLFDRRGNAALEARVLDSGQPVISVAGTNGASVIVTVPDGEPTLSLVDANGVSRLAGAIAGGRVALAVAYAQGRPVWGVTKHNGEVQEGELVELPATGGAPDTESEPAVGPN
jgi:hypothetical protein